MITPDNDIKLLSGWWIGMRTLGKCRHVRPCFEISPPTISPTLSSFAWGQNIFLPSAAKNIPSKNCSLNAALWCVLLHGHIIFKYIRSISIGKEIRNWWVIHVADFVSVGANIRNLVHTHILPPNLGPCQSLASYVRPFQSPSIDYATIHPWESRPISCNCSWAASLSLYFSLAFDSTGNQSFIKFSNAQSTFAI